MKIFIERILDAFYPKELREKIPKADEVNVRGIVAELSSGNLNLRLGRYMTQEQMDARAKEIYNNFYTA